MKSLTIYAVCISLIFGPMAGFVDGKLVVDSPEGMIKNSPYIIVGKVKAQRESKGGSRTTVRVEKVLKGSMPEKEITMVQARVPKFGFAELPQPETRVMLFLQKSDDKRYSLYTDLNNVGTVDENNTVKLYKGAESINQKEAKDYELVYTTFLFQTYDAEKKLVEFKGKKEQPLLWVSLVLGLILITFAVLKLKRR